MSDNAERNYKNALTESSVDLVAAAETGQLSLTMFRKREIQAVLDQLNSGRSVLLTGPAGVGKTAVIHGVAAALSRRTSTGTGIQGLAAQEDKIRESRHSIRGLRRLSTASIMADTVYLGQWETKVTRIAEAAIQEQCALYFSDIVNLASAGRSNQNSTSVLDALRPYLEQGVLCLVGEATPEQLSAMQRLPSFANVFQKVPLAPLDDACVDAILEQTASTQNAELDKTARQTLIQLTTRFLARLQPDPALELLGRARDYQIQKQAIGEPEAITPAFIEKVFAIYSGLPRFVVSREINISAREIRDWFKERIIGQDEAIEAVVETITLFKAGLHDPQRPLGAFLFVGPTGVGKTELARALAKFLFGNPARLLRFDLSEFKDYYAFHLLLGDPDHPQQPARLLDPVREQPFQVILFDELEKAHPNLWDIFLQLLDDGRLTPPGGQTVDFRNTLIIATSNVGAQEAENRIGFVTDDSIDSRRQSIQKTLENAFRPEFLNRFQHIAVFHPLSRQQVHTIARQELRRILNREGITARNLIVDVDDSALELTLERGFDPRYGARGLKREIQRQLVLPLATRLMESGAEHGQILRLTGHAGRIQIRAVDTPASRVVHAEKNPLQLPGGRRLPPNELQSRIVALQENIETLAQDLHENTLLQERDRLSELRTDPEFWSHTERAANVLNELDRLTANLERLEKLRASAAELRELTDPPKHRSNIEVGRRYLELDHAFTEARRELLLLGEKGLPDACIEIRPVAPHGILACELLVPTYMAWAKALGFTVDWLLEPLHPEESNLFAIRGPYASGLLRAEHGWHRVRKAEYSGVASVRIAAIVDDAHAQPTFKVHRALKKTGRFGGKIRARVECDNGLILQNARTLNENHELASAMAATWRNLPAPSEHIVRRYDLEPPKVRDYLTGTSSSRADALAPEHFHKLLCRRVELLAS